MTYLMKLPTIRRGDAILAPFFIALAGIMLMASPASAVIQTFTDLASWQAALSRPELMEDFEAADIGGDGDDDSGAEDIFFGTGSTLSPNGQLRLSANANFSANALIDVAPFLSTGADLNGNVVVNMRFIDQGNGANPQETVTVALREGISAFAFEYNNYDGQDDATFLSFEGTNGGTVAAFDPGLSGTTQFFGVVDTDPGATIDSFSFTGDPLTGNGFSAFNSFDDVRYTEFDSLKIRINTDTGLTEIVNDTASAFEIDSYRLVSTTDDLNFANWNSLSDQSIDAIDGLDPDSIVGNGIGETWDQAGGSDDGVLAESFLLGTSLFGAGRTESLGNAFTPGGDTGALSFEYRRVADGEIFNGVLEFVTGGVLGDFDNDGDVDGDDFGVFVGVFGTSPGGPPFNDADFDMDGDVDGDDFGVFVGQFGIGTSTAIPEPTTGSLLALALASAMLGARRRQS